MPWTKSGHRFPSIYFFMPADCDLIGDHPTFLLIVDQALSLLSPVVKERFPVASISSGSLVSISDFWHFAQRKTAILGSFSFTSVPPLTPLSLTHAAIFSSRIVGAYSASDPSININIYAEPAMSQTTYKVPGPRKMFLISQATVFHIGHISGSSLNSRLERSVNGSSTTPCSKEALRGKMGRRLMLMIILSLGYLL